MKYFVDTNIILRFLTRDEEVQFRACRELFKKAKAGKIDLITSSLVIFEIIWTLISYYEEPKTSVIEKIISLLELPHFTVEHKEIILESLAIWQHKNIKFNDAFNFVWTQKGKIALIYSYDKDFDLLPQIKRIEPV
ncbi:type II toxin-antitoxin system VapC family toxin [Candidatus Gottesmanbacteria bacterium]|nr:type II toxin-antitoxin system VapC family toxin [Candidatus Gottesmanbacteria bacterium]